MGGSKKITITIPLDLWPPVPRKYWPPPYMVLRMKNFKIKHSVPFCFSDHTCIWQKSIHVVYHFFAFVFSDGNNTQKTWSNPILSMCCLILVIPVPVQSMHHIIVDKIRNGKDLRQQPVGFYGGHLFWEKNIFSPIFTKNKNCTRYVDIMLNQFNSGVIDLHLKRLSSRKYKTWLTSQKNNFAAVEKKINNFARFFPKKIISLDRKRWPPPKDQLVAALMWWSKLKSEIESYSDPLTESFGTFFFHEGIF